MLAPAPAAAAAGDSAPGFLILRVFQPGTVWLNESLIRDLSGQTERAPRPWDMVVAQSAELPAGSYRLRLKSADGLVVMPLDEVEFQLAARETVDVALGRPLLLSSPSGATVSVGGKERGATPIRLDPDQIGGAEITLARTGYQTWSQSGDSLLVHTRAAGALRVELEPARGVPPAPGSAYAPRRYLGLRRTPALLTSVAFVVAGATSAIALKGVADDRFEAYRRTGDPGRQRRLFASAQRYDRLSLVGWAVAEAAFLASFYLIIQEEPRGLIPTVTAERGPDGSPGWRVGVRHGF